MRKYSSNLAFVDMLFNLLIGFTSLFIIAFLLINPIAKQGKIDPVTQIMITAQWDAESVVDFDLWVRGPDGARASYQGKDRRYMVLDRDDLGIANDRYVINGVLKTVKRNIETLTINDIVPGEYVVSIHYFGPAKSPGADAVTVEITDMHPFRIVYGETHTLTLKQEKSFVSFVVTEEGQIVDIRTDVEIYLRTPQVGN